MQLGINKHGVIFVENARISGLTVGGRLIVNAGESGDVGGLNIEVDERSLLRLHHMIDEHFSRQGRSIPEELQALRPKC